MGITINIRGEEFTEATIIKALESSGHYQTPIKEKYVFKAGDIAQNNNGELRLIFETLGGDLGSIALDGVRILSDTASQNYLEFWDYEKLGEIGDLVNHSTIAKYYGDRK